MYSPFKHTNTLIVHPIRWHYHVYICTFGRVVRVVVRGGTVVAVVVGVVVGGGGKGVVVVEVGVGVERKGSQDR